MPSSNAALPAVSAEINYTVDDGKEPNYYFYEPEGEVEMNPPGTDARQVMIHNAWPEIDQFSVDGSGFELHDFPGSFQGFDEDQKIVGEFYPQVVDFVQQHTGAKRVVVFDHTIRRRMSNEQMESNVQDEKSVVNRPAVLLVHSDYTPQSGPQRVRDILPEEADALLKNRVAFFNVWKPLYNVVEELPLAFCDSRTSTDEDFITMKLMYRDRTGEIFVMRHTEHHKWYYFPRIEPHQAVLLKTYDSEPHRARFTGHSAFEDPTTPENHKKRESVEVRTMAFF
ncbi:MAG: CmcJ/NvfI family oxidoreductase [bacterium]|jgi:hypothetical protein